MEAFLNLSGAKNDPKNASLLKQAQNFWSMLDNMAESSPDSYK
jgi:hypothetical protein